MPNQVMLEAVSLFVHLGALSELTNLHSTSEIRQRHQTTDHDMRRGGSGLRGVIGQVRSSRIEGWRLRFCGGHYCVSMPGTWQHNDGRTPNV